MKLNWNFQRVVGGGGGGVRKIPSIGGCGCQYFLKLQIVFCYCGFFQEQIGILLGGSEKVDAHHISSCVSYCKEKYTLWRADIRKKVEINDDSV